MPIMSTEIASAHGDVCKSCGGPKAVRNPTGICDHLYWPDKLTDDAKRANGYKPTATIHWAKEDMTPGAKTQF